MTLEQLKEWEIYLELEPQGGKADDERFGEICATLVNLKLPSSERMKEPSDFFPRLKPRLTEEEREALEKQEEESRVLLEEAQHRFMQNIIKARELVNERQKREKENGS